MTFDKVIKYMMIQIKLKVIGLLKVIRLLADV
jgi:hypothetical protein